MAKRTARQRVSRKEQRRQQIEREKRMRLLRVWGPVGLVVILGLIAVGVFISRQFAPDVEGAVLIDNIPGGQHDDTLTIDFGGLPPIGGPHRSIWQNCGIYREPVLPEYAVHSLEHGTVWITYHPELPQGEIDNLEVAARGQSLMLVSPYPDQASPVVMTAWGVQLELEDGFDERVDTFINRYRGRQGPEAGASCSGGIGDPIS